MFKIKLELFARTILGYLVILVALFFLAWLQGKVINAIIMIASYFSTRWIFPKTFHAKTDKNCLIFSIACFSIAVIICIPIKISITFNVIIGGAISILLFFIQRYIELLSTPKVSNKELFIQKCKELNYNELKTQMAIKFFIDKEKPKDVWLWLCETQDNPIEWDSVKKIKYRMKKDLFE